jgi:hypothetical protein
MRALNLTRLPRASKISYFSDRLLDDGSVLLRLAEFPDEEMSSYQVQKTLVKNHLNPNAFFDLNKGADYTYSVPDFSWREPLH